MNPGPRSLHVISSLSLGAGGPTQSVTQLCEALNAQGAPAEIATVESPDHLIWEGRTPIHTFPEAWPAKLRRSPALKAFITRELPRFDLVHVHGLWQWPGLYARQAAQNLGIPLVISPRGMLEPWSLQQRGLFKRTALALWERKNLRTAALLHATGEPEAHQILSLGFRQPMSVIPNGVNIPDLPDLPLASATPRRVLFLSRFHPKKGVDVLLQAWSALQERHPDWVLDLYGPDEGGYRVEMKHLAASLGMTGSRILFGDAITGAAKRDLFQSASLLVLPTHSENFGNVVAEALAHGLPVITTQGTPWQGLESHGCGWWIPFGKAPLEQALELALALSPETLRTMGAQGRTWMTTTHTWNAIAQSMIQAYQSLPFRQDRAEFLL